VEVKIDENTRQLFFVPDDNFYASHDPSMSIAARKAIIKEHKNFFREKRLELLPYTVAIENMKFPIFWETEKWIVFTLVGKWTRDYIHEYNRATTEQYGLFWFELEDDLLAFKLRYEGCTL